MNCIVIDDEKMSRDILKSYIDDVPYLKLIFSFKNALEALDYMRDKNDIDIIFLDINMPKLSGLDAAKQLNNSKIIFTTAHREFAINGFELNAVDYLLKPFSFKRFVNAVQRISNLSENVEGTKHNGVRRYIDLKIGKKIQRIMTADLLYIEGLSNYVQLKTTKGTLVAYKKLNDLINELPEQFIRVHKSYIINSSKINSYTKDAIEVDSKDIPIGLTYKDKVTKLLTS